jgi:CheY-like chemotaxis protein
MSAESEADDQRECLDAATPTAPAMRILVVDDSELVRRLAVRILEARPGLEAVLACDGKEALQVIAADPPAVVLTDLDMPGMDGLELVKAVRRRHGHIPVILMTAHGSEEIAVRALRAGAANYVPKKDLVHELLETLDSVLAAVAFDRRRRRALRCLTSRRSSFEVENDPELITPLSNLFQEELDTVGFADRTTCIRVGVALTEALTNALFHGNLEVSTDLRQDDDQAFFEVAEARRTVSPCCDRRIHVTASLDADAAVYLIRDEGPGFDHARTALVDETHNLTRIGGRGLLLIRTFMDEVIYNAPGNQVELIKRRDPGFLPAGRR